jgi:hypothetical protein
MCSTLMPAVRLRRRPQRPRSETDVPRHRPADAKRRRVTQAGFNPPVNRHASSLFVILMPHHRWTGPPRNQGSARRSPHENFVRRSCAAYLLQKFPRSGRFPKLHSGPQPSGGSCIRTMHESNGPATHRTGGQGKSPVRPHPLSVRSSRSGPSKRKPEEDRSSCCNTRTMP